jgi:hypothetical protein
MKKRSAKSMKAKSTAGIRDWEAKRFVLRSLFGVASDKGLVEDISIEFKLGLGEDRLDVVRRLYDTYRRWNQNLPTGAWSLEFWRRVIADQKLRVRSQTLWTSGIVDFIGYFPDDTDRQNAVKEILADQPGLIDLDTQAALKEKYLSSSAVVVSVSPQELNGQYQIVSNEHVNFEGPNSGLVEGSVRVDQFYNCPESAKAWIELIDAARYQMYLDCLVSLRRMSETASWKEAHSNNGDRVLVSLGGGGSPEKDVVLFESIVKLLQQDQKLMYFVSDISPFMLHQTAKALLRLVVKNGIAPKVDLRFHINDFLKLQRTFSRPKGNGTITWTLLGGTIGNVNELQFFQSINGPSQRDDLLLIGIDTLRDGETNEEFQGRMEQQYNSKETESLLLAPMFRGQNQGVTDSSVRLSFPKKSDESKYSNVPNSKTVAFHHGDCCIARSTRYVFDEFLSFVNDLGWRLRHSEKPSEDSSYRT